MANDKSALETMKKESIRVCTGMTAVFPQFQEEHALDISELVPKFNGCFATNNSTVAFISEGQMYVTPYTSVAVHTLSAANFSYKVFYVPFSNGDYPKEEEAKWEELRKKAIESYEADFAKTCIKYSEKIGIGKLEDIVMEKCFEIPSCGLWVKHLYEERWYYPVINSMFFDAHAISYIGKFSCNNGKVVFVYRNGKTYVTKGYRIINRLKKEGYKLIDMFVPLSNGEEIQDPKLKARWNSITKCY